MKPSAESGSSPLELVMFTALLLLPLGLGLSTYQQLSNELAAESIVRHALRLAMLQNPTQPSEALPWAVGQLASDWELSGIDYRYWCSAHCTLVTLEVSITGARAIQTMGTPKL